METELPSSRRWMWRLVAAPVDIASLAAFRVLFGSMMAAAMVRFLAKGWVGQMYVEPVFHFTYPGLDWVRPWPEALMHAHFVVLALLALGVALGFYYRACVVLFFVGFTYVELLDQTTYLNHYYLISLLSGLMIFLPAHRAWSLDVLRKPDLLLAVVPAWTLNIMRLQIGVVYFFAGLAKLNADWLFHAQPLRIWLAARSDLPLLGVWLEQPWAAYFASWFGALFDLSIVFFLLWRRTRRAGYAVLVVFHVATWVLFNIGMFPWIMMVGATLLFSADWPRRLFSGRLCKGAVAAISASSLSRREKFLIAPLAAYVAVQLFLPLRPHFMREPSAWTGTGFNCAWQVMIVEKTGFVEFYACDPRSGQRWKIPAKKYLTARQEQMMAQDPYLIRAFARWLADDLSAQGFAGAQIKVDAYATLNGRPSQRLIDEEVDLAGRTEGDWVLPLMRLARR